MIKDLPSTTTGAVNRALIDLRDQGGAVALGRVLTLVISTDEEDAEAPISAANEASREHPSRVIVLVRGNRRARTRLDAQIRVGGDAGASEVVVMRMHGPLAEHGASVAVPLLLPDAPIVAWWPATAPKDLAGDPVGRMAQRRITDAAAASNPSQALAQRQRTYAAGDTDFAWTRLTRWRALLAAALDQPPFEPVREATVVGASNNPSTDLLAAWLGQYLRCPVTRARGRAGTGISSVTLTRESGAVELVRPDDTVATLRQPGQPERRIALARRGVPECLAEELRRLDPDEVYGDVLTQGLKRLGKARTTTAAKARDAGKAPSLQEAAQAQREAEEDVSDTVRQMEQADPGG